MKLRHLFLPHSFHHKKAAVVSEFGFAIYALVILVIGITLFITKQTNPTVLSYATHINASDVITFTNQERVKNGDTPVNASPLLTLAAEQKAKDMFAKNYWAHFGPNGEKPWDFIQKAGYTYTAAGENLARDFDDSQSVVTAWMNSPSHRENLLNNNYQDIGIAVVNGTLLGHETTLVVQLFGKPYKTTALLPQAEAAEQTPAQVAAVKTTTPPSPTAVAVAQVMTPPPAVPQNQPTTPTVTPQQAATPQPEPNTILPTGLKIRPLSVTKPIAIVLLIFVSIFLFVDMIIIRKRGVVRLATHSFAHIAIISVIIFSILALKAGQII